MSSNVACVLHRRCVDGVRGGVSAWLAFGCISCGQVVVQVVSFCGGVLVL